MDKEVINNVVIYIVDLPFLDTIPLGIGSYTYEV